MEGETDRQTEIDLLKYVALFSQERAKIWLSPLSLNKHSVVRSKESVGKELILY